MQEVIIFLSSIAGVCTAAAVKKFPRRTQLSSLGTSSHIKTQINSLVIEKEILSKTIARLYQNNVDLNKVQRDQLLSRYQYQLGIVLAKIEKLEAASKHPDLGPVGEGLITLMDQKLSKLDKRLYDISSKITITNSQVVEKELDRSKEEKIKEFKRQVVEQKVPEKPQTQPSIPIIQTYLSSPPKPVELTTLTEIPNKIPQFPFIEQKQSQPKNEIVEEILKPQENTDEKIKIVQTSLSNLEFKPETSNPQVSEQLTPAVNIPLDENKPKPVVKLPEEEKLEEDDDLSKIKGEIMKTLSKLEQAEVE